MQTSWPLHILIADNRPVDAELMLLIADSRSADAELMLDELRRTGFEPHWQRVDSAAAYAECLDPHLDLILADHNLPDLSVQEALTMLRERGLDIPFIVVSGTLGEVLAVTALKHGASDYLLKDRLDGLGASVKQALAAKQRRAEQRQEVAELRASEERYRLLAENITDMIVRFTPQGVILYISPSSRSVLGYEPEEMIGRSAREFTHPDDADAIINARLSMLIQSRIITLTYRLRHKRGNYVWIETTLRALHDAEGSVQELISVSRDISEQKQAKTVLVEERNVLRTLIDNLPDYIFTKDTEGRFVISNLAHAQAVQLEPEALIGKTASELFAPKLAAQYERDDQVVLKGQALTNIERITTDATGNERSVLSTKVPLRGVDGQIVGLVGISRDITDRKQAEGTLRESEARFRHLFENNPYPMYVFDRETLMFLDVNEAATERYGYSCEEFLQMRITDIRAAEDAAPALNAIREAPDQPLTNREGQHRLKDGHIIDVETVSHRLDFAGREAYLVVVQDITERKRAEMALLEEHNLLSTLIDALPDAVYIKDIQGRIILDNIQNKRNLGTIAQPTETIGKTDFDFHPRELAEQFWADEQRIIQSGQALIDHEEPDIDPQGNLGWHLTTKVPLRDQTGKIMGTVGISRSITQRKLAEDQLRQSEAAEHEQRVLAETFRDTAAALTSTLDPAQVMAGILENVGRVVPHDEANIMLIEGDFVRPVYWHAASPDTEALLKTVRFPLNSRDFGEIITTGMPVIIADTNLDPDWPTKLLRSRVSVPIQVNGQIFGFLNLLSFMPGFFTTSQAERLQTFANQAAIAIENAQLYDKLNRYTDLLEQQVDERTLELRMALAKERALNDFKSRIVTTISHEFRTPLAALQVASDLLKKYSHKMTDEQKLQRFDKIEAEIKKMTSLLQAVLTFDQSEAGQLEFQPAPLNLEAFCQKLVDEVHLARQDTQRLVLEVEGCGADFVADETLLRQIFTNLLSNAEKFSPDNSEIHWAVACLPDQTVFHVRDEGIGIPSEDQVRIFEPFQRAKNVDNIAGTGLGLAIVKQAVDRHGGTISCESEVGRGTTFIVNIPVRSRPVTVLTNSSKMNPVS